MFKIASVIIILQKKEQFQLSLMEHHVDFVNKELSKSIEMHVKSQEFGEESSVEVKESTVHGRGVFAECPSILG